MGVAGQDCIERCCLTAFSLTLLGMVLCLASEKVPPRTSWQAPAHEAPRSKASGLWSSWGSWSACSQPCGLGVSERARTCQSQDQGVPRAGWKELVLQPSFPQQQPGPEEHSLHPNMARPASPLHSTSLRGGNMALVYGAANRHVHQEAFPAINGPLAPSQWVPLFPSNRPREPSPFWQSPHSRGSPHGLEKLPSRSRAPWPSSTGGSWPAQNVISLFKSVRQDGWEGNPGPEEVPHGGQLNSQPLNWATSPMLNSQVDLRSRVRETIKPGKYGYGRVPFALPLHRETAKEDTPRFKRHHTDGSTEVPPPPPLPLPPAKMEMPKVVHPSAPEEHSTSSWGPWMLAEVQAPLPETDDTEGLAGVSPFTDLATISGVGSRPLNKSNPRGKSVASNGTYQTGQLITPAVLHPPGSVTAAFLRSHSASKEVPNLELSFSRGHRTDKGSPDIVASPPESRASSLPGSPPLQDLRRRFHFSRDYSSASQENIPKRRQKVQAAPERSPRRPSSHLLRQSHTRSWSHRLGQSQGSNRAPQPMHGFFADQPAHHRLAEPDVWLMHRDRLVQFHARTGLLPETEGSWWNLYAPGTETIHCKGESRQLRACKQEPCPADRPDPRTVQCAAYNDQEFMGRFYQWEPFTDVRGSQRCELNCRPIGYRFYVRHTEKVQDGTPCESSLQDICVAGQCLSPGCDGILGSNRTLNRCGVCSGDHSMCKLVAGNYTEMHVPIGYHHILEIPAGATRIRVQEMTRSPNYLALRTQSGKSIINGNWAVNPPGNYEAAGTVFVYSHLGGDREEVELLSAEGPTTEPIELYMIFQQNNPGVSYHFFLTSAQPDPSHHEMPGAPEKFDEPSQRTTGTLGALTQLEPPADSVWPQMSASRQTLIPAPLLVSSGQSGRRRGVPPLLAPASQSQRSPGTLQRVARVPPVPPPQIQENSQMGHDFYWQQLGNTECSASCGKGFWQSLYRCISRASQEEVGEEKCLLLPKPVLPAEVCNTEPCPAYWDVGEWSACSKSCGLGTQHRQALCRQIYANHTTTVHAQHCAHLEKPNTTQHCQVQPCSHWEVHSNWSSCSVLCGTGHRSRRVACVSHYGDLLSDRDCPGSHRPQSREACDMGPCVRTWFYSDWSNTCSADCGTGIQRRSVVCLSASEDGQLELNCTGPKLSDMRACNSGPCQRVVQWYRGPWSTCSMECGSGSQRRDVICISKQGMQFNLSEAAECAHLEKPPSLQPCFGTDCEGRWFTTAWSACSRSCRGGVQVREVQCLTYNRTLSILCHPDLKPVKKRPCNSQPCLLKLDETCRDKYPNCAVIVQARLCVYSYYKVGCCASCSHALERGRTNPSR